MDALEPESIHQEVVLCQALSHIECPVQSRWQSGSAKAVKGCHVLLQHLPQEATCFSGWQPPVLDSEDQVHCLADQLEEGHMRVQGPPTGNTSCHEVGHDP